MELEPSVSELAASIVHEVNQPLSAVLTNGEACLRWLDRDPIDAAAVRFSVERMIVNGRRAVDIVARLRLLARRCMPEKEPVHINDLVGDVAALLTGEFEKREIRLVLDLGVELPQVLADRIELQQVLINLAMNAAQALNATTSRPKLLTICTLASHCRSKVQLHVSDNGPGLGEADPTRLFDAFYTTKDDGMGMGLFICRSILSLHNGKIEVREPEAGIGACFAIELDGQLTKDIAA